MLRPNYNNLWKLLIDKRIKKSYLKEALKIAPSTYTKMNHNKLVSMEVIMRICDYLNCNIEDVMMFERDEQEVNCNEGV